MDNSRSRGWAAFGNGPLKSNYSARKLVVCNFLGALAALAPVAATAEPQCRTTVSGTVTDEQGVPLPGATVLILGTPIGARTDELGRYVIVVPADHANGPTLVLIGRVMGYATLQIPILVAQGSAIRQNLVLAVNAPNPEPFSRREPVM